MLRRKSYLLTAVIAALVVAHGAPVSAGEAVKQGAAANGKAVAAAVTNIDSAIRTPASVGMTPGAPVTISRSKDGLFYINASVGGRYVRFLIDTGANVTVLTRADAERLGLTNAAAGRGAMLQTVGGPTAMRWAKIPQMHVANMPVTNVDAAIIDQGIEVSLLGQNVLSRLNGITIRGDQLQIHAQ